MSRINTFPSSNNKCCSVLKKYSIFLFFSFFIIHFSFPQKSEEPKLFLRGYVKDLVTINFNDQLDKTFIDNLVHNRLNLNWLPNDNLTVKFEIRNRIFTGDLIELIPNYSNFIDAQESILNQWHIYNPPTAWYIQRNNKIFAVQKNRNPFIDHPEFIERMNVIGGTDTKPVIKKLEVAQSAISYSGVSTSSERVVYLVNTGNQDISAISEVTSESGNVIVKSVQAGAAEGEVSQIVLGFDNLAPGTYTDKLKIDLVSQTGESIEIPITFTLETASVYTPAFGSLKVFYNPNKKRAQLIDAPKNIESLEVYDIRGNQIELNEISNSFTDIDFYGRSNGVYFVVVKTKSEAYTAKILVY